jgi:hypothetical protein
MNQTSRLDERLDEALEESFPASDPPAVHALEHDPGTAGQPAETTISADTRRDSADRD